MKSLFMIFFFVTWIGTFAQPTFIKKTSFTTGGQFPYNPTDTLCGPKKMVVGHDGRVALYTKTIQNTNQLFILDSTLSINSPIFTSYRSGQQWNLLIDMIATPDSSFLYLIQYAVPGNAVWEPTLYKVGGNSWIYAFPTGLWGEEIYSIALTPDGNYACQGVDTLYIISPTGQRIANPSNSSDYLITNYTNGEQLINHQQILQRKDPLSNIIWAQPFVGAYIANDSMLYNISTDTIKRLNPMDGSIMWTSFAQDIQTYDFSLDGGCIWLNSMGELRIHDSTGAILLSKSFEFPLHGLSLVRTLPTGIYLTGGAYASNTFMYTTEYYYSSFLATLDSAGNGMIDSTSVLWPTDANHDHYLAYSDIAYLNLSNGEEGPPRDIWPASLSTGFHYSDFGIDWNQSFVTGLNYKFSDANGDGIVDSLDFDAFSYVPLIPTQVYLRKGSGGIVNPTFSFIPERDTVSPGDTVRFYFILGDSVNRVDSISAIAFGAFDYSEYFNSNLVNLQAMDNDLGLSTELRFNSVTSGQWYAGFGFMLARIDKQDRYNYYDTLGFVDIEISDTVTVSQMQALTFSSISALNSLGIERELTIVSAGVFIQALPVSIPKHVNFEFILSPNPSDQQLRIKMQDGEKKLMRILDVPGRIVREFYSSESDIIIPIADLPNGIYILSVLKGSARLNKRFSVQHR